MKRTFLPFWVALLLGATGIFATTPPPNLNLGNLPLQININPGASVTYTFDLPITEVLTRNPNVTNISINGADVTFTGLATGRTGLKITANNGLSYYMGLRVNTSLGAVPGLPDYLSVGSVSEDVAADLAFWKDVQPGLKNKSMDIRYIYVNGGPLTGWRTWGIDRPGKFSRESLRHGLIPFFVYYNIPDDGESYTLDLAHANDVAYMTAYFEDLDQFMDSVQANMQGELYGIILEPDFLGYMQQNASPNEPTSITTCVGPNTIAPGAGNIKTLVQRINKAIKDKRTAGHKVLFGWQLNLWSAGSSPIRLTDTQGFPQGRASIKTASEETILYAIRSGIFANCADFVSIDKYGLDACGHINDPNNPFNVTWFFNNDHWRNYLYYVKQFWKTSGYPVVLWQLPVGHINNSSTVSAYTGSQYSPLPNTDRKYEDSSTSFFFGDTYNASNANRLNYFSQNLYAEPGLTVNGNDISWANHLAMTRDSGVISMLMGAGVNSSTDGIGSPPTDDYFWVQKVQGYYSGGTLPLTPSMFTPCCGTTCAPRAGFSFPANGQTIYQAPESMCSGCFDPIALKFRLFDLDGALTAATLTLTKQPNGTPQTFTLTNLNSGIFTQNWLAPDFGIYTAAIAGTDNDGNSVYHSITFTLAEWTATTCDEPSWNVNTVYGPPNQTVAWEGGKYHNLWWTQGEEPGQGPPWSYNGDCSFMAIPVELVRFRATARCDKKEVHLEWATASERWAEGFEVQRLEGGEWQDLGFVPTAVGNAGSLRNYVFKDASAISGNGYYRLQMLDLDGGAVYSNIVETQCLGKEGFQVFPNPFDKMLHFEWEADFGGWARVFDARGQLMYETQSGTGISSLINSENWAAGVYVVQVFRSGKWGVEKVVKQ